MTSDIISLQVRRVDNGWIVNISRALPSKYTLDRLGSGFDPSEYNFEWVFESEDALHDFFQEMRWHTDE